MNLLKDKNVSIAFIVVSVVLAVLVIPCLSMNVLKHLDSAVVRVALMVAIVGFSLVDPVKALLLAILLVIALQTLADLKTAKTKPKTNVVSLVSDLVNNLKNKVNNVNDVISDEPDDELSDELSDELGDEGSDNAFDEAVDVDTGDNEAMKFDGLEANDLLNPDESELLNNSLAFNNVPENSVSQPVLLGEVPTNDSRTVKNFNAEPYNNGISRAKTKLPEQLEDTSNKVVIGSLLNEGFENPGDSNNLSVEETSEEKELNNVLTSQVENKKVCVFTTNNQLLDIQTNEVGCRGNDTRVGSSKDQQGPQGDVRPYGY